MGFANGLKYLMRQDPDVLLVGEIRDHETATAAVQAALTGHLLISTLHANDAVGTVARLADLGLDNFKIAGSLVASIAQRLLRQNLPPLPGGAAGEQKAARPAVRRAGRPPRRSTPDAVYYEGAGCDRCHGTGYDGRVPIYEIMTVTPELERGDRGRPARQQAPRARRRGRHGRAGPRRPAAGAGRASRPSKRSTSSWPVDGRCGDMRPACRPGRLPRPPETRRAREPRVATQIFPISMSAATAAAAPPAGVCSVSCTRCSRFRSAGGSRSVKIRKKDLVADSAEPLHAGLQRGRACRSRCATLREDPANKRYAAVLDRVGGERGDGQHAVGVAGAVPGQRSRRWSPTSCASGSGPGPCRTASTA